MNKDTIYIEPEDDITDIITKIENSKSKIVALVPPKKAGVFRSVVNIKLIAKASKTADKTVVLVTVDPSITKLAAVTKLPVAKDLNTAPVVPTVENADEKVETESTEEIEEPDEEGEDEVEEETEKEEKEEAEEAEEETEDEAEAEEETEDEEEEKPEKKPKKDKKQKTGLGKKHNKFVTWILTHKKLAIAGGIGLLALIGFLIWALFIAPAVDVFVSIKTDSNNFSEVISFVKEQKDENMEEGKVYLEERKIETESEVKFDPTGQKNVGDKASGKVKVSAIFSGTGSIAINAGTIFSYNGLSFSANEYHSLGWDGDEDKCENTKKIVVNPDGTMGIRCLITEEVNITAVEGGTKYNVAASSSGWDTISGASVVSESAMSGGTDDIITVVQQSDVEKAKESLKSADEEQNKEDLYKTIPEDSIILESTFNQETSAATATPAVDEEVKDGVTPTLKATTTTSVFIIDRTKLEELIKEKVKLPDDKKIFEIRNVYIDGFKETDNGFTGKLKAVYFTGPKITESEIVEKIKGKGLGDARREICDIEGVTDDTRIDKSYPWVTLVPTDSNKITVSFEIKDQDGNKIEEKQDNKDGEESDQEKSDKTDEKSDENKQSEEKQ